MAAPSDDAAASPDPLAFALELVPPVEFAFAYGSEVFRQGGHPGGGMVDYVFAVRDPARWHEANLRRNACHYSFIKHGGPRFVAAVQDQIPAFVYYNTLVDAEGPVGPARIKYGVISVDRLVEDLEQWTTLYISGRMQKPVRVLRSCERLAAPARSNLRVALAASLLQLPASFTVTELFMTVAGLSYGGDFRMRVGENPAKVKNIVEPHLSAFWDLYQPAIEGAAHVGLLHVPTGVGACSDPPLRDAVIYQDASAGGRAAAFGLLRPAVQERVARGVGLSRDAFEDVLRSGTRARSAALAGNATRCALEAVVGRAAWRQSVKGLATAGVRKSGVYVWEKLRKRFRV